ncbi:MAG: YdiU family protein, partial [Rhodothermales bacterium]|nr:YdiU family protein [Rhodothermales bacterium]
QLGDGRALLLGEVIDRHGHRRDIHLKGSGRTPFSRGGDGKAVLGPVLREYLIGEAMHALGIPTTRALAAVKTGESVHREGPKPGAVLARVASSHIRVGTFEFFAVRQDTEKLTRLADYAIRRHDPDLAGQEDCYLAFLHRVVARQAALVARWMHVGFVHGVMNTDNMTVSGETIDYGPCAFIDAYDPRAVFSSIDHQGRYAYGNQPTIAQWNLARFAEALLSLLDPDENRAVELAVDAVRSFMEQYEAAYLGGMRRKLGLGTPAAEDAGIVADLLGAMEGQEVDFTLFFRYLSAAALGQVEPVRALFREPARIDAWLGAWRERLAREPAPATERAAAMNRVNPLYIPRNHLVEATLEAAMDRGDLQPFDRLLEAVSDPFVEREGWEAYTEPAPAGFGPYATFCGT